MIKYQFAYNSEGDLVNISDLSSANRHNTTYQCVGCGNEMIARLGSRKTHHFAHKAQLECSGETYLHQLGKKVFFDTYNECLNEKIPFLIELEQKTYCNHFEEQFGVKCPVHKKPVSFDLTKHFKSITFEKKEGNFIPDLALISDSTGHKIFIEIAVTHKSSSHKLKSGYKIIEFEIEKESDLDCIKNRKISFANRSIGFYKFDTKPIIKDNCCGKCHKDHHLLTLDIKGRILLREMPLDQIDLILKQSKKFLQRNEVSQTPPVSSSGKFLNAIGRFSNSKLKVRNCYICKYHAKNTNPYYEHEGPIFCKFHKERGSSNKAVNCEIFNPFTKYIKEVRELGSQFDSKTGEYIGSLPIDINDWWNSQSPPEFDELNNSTN